MRNLLSYLYFRVVSTKPVYFPGLNGLRFFAAFAVILTHVELMKKYLGFAHLWLDPGRMYSTSAIVHVSRGEVSWFSPIVAEAGPLGVIFFFVLSGFLITFLLYREFDQEGKIAIGGFYMRRILRIWPLYFLIFLLGFFVLPHSKLFYVPEQSEAFASNFMGNFWCYVAFLPNLAYSLYMAVPNIGQSWSIGVEEQFYLLWPLIISLSGKSLKPLIWFTVILIFGKMAFILITSGSADSGVLAAKKFLAMSKLECMSIGGIGAWILYHGKERILNLIFNKFFQALCLFGVIGVLYLLPPALQDGAYLIYAICFLVVIMNVAGNERSLIRSSSGVWVFLGNISYGIYMYHLMIITLVLHLLMMAGFSGKGAPWYFHLFAYVFSIALTIGVAYISYRYFEKPWIRLKHRFTRVASGHEAAQDTLKS